MIRYALIEGPMYVQVDMCFNTSASADMTQPKKYSLIEYQIWLRDNFYSTGTAYRNLNFNLERMSWT